MNFNSFFAFNKKAPVTQPGKVSDLQFLSIPGAAPILREKCVQDTRGVGRTLRSSY